MDKSIVAVEESHWRNDSPSSASKSLESLVQINSIAIDLSCAMEEIESPIHEHFSIRGFVAGMRKKDWKACLPFASENRNDDLEDNLPPLSVPKFRWWQCSTCVPDIIADNTALKMLLVDRSDAGTSSCQRGKEVLYSDDIRHMGDGHGSREPIDGVYNDLMSHMIESNPHCKGHKSTICSKVKIDAKNNNCGVSSAYITEANPVRNGERHGSDADASDTVRVADNTAIGIDEADNVSSGSDAAVCALPRRRKPKLRSLADIMEEKNNSTSEHVKMRSALSGEMQVTSTEKEDDLHHHPELEASADVATVTRNPHRKRKIASEEDRVPPQATNPLVTAKRFKGPIRDSEKRYRIVEESDSESGDGSAQSEMQLSAKPQKFKLKRNKALEISRKMKQTHSGGNRTVPVREMPKIGSMLSESLQKHVASVETSFDNMEHVPPSHRGEIEPYLSSLIPGKQVVRISDKSKSKRPEVEVDLNPLMPQRQSFVGDDSVQGKVTLDLSLDIYTDAERSSNNQISCRQHMSIPDLNESFTERQFGLSEPEAVQKKHNNVEPGGNSDDIPMDIVELLAKKQLERTLENSRNHIRGSPAVYAGGRSGVISFPLSSARSGISVPGGETRLGQGFLSFPHAKNRHLDKGNMEDNQFRLFNSLKPYQPNKTQYVASNSLFSGPKPSEGADLLWPPRRKNVPFHLDVHRNYSVQHNDLDMQAFPDQSYKGKTIGDMKGEVRKAADDASAVKEGRIGSSTKSARSLDSYSNDAIPAMQLLSLMDRAIVSGSSLKVGSNSYLDKPFSPCNHHPRSNPNENPNDPFLNGSFFSHGGLNGVRFPGESSKKFYARGHMPPPQGNTKAFNLDSRDNLASQPSRGNVELEICSVNRNPADFSIPDAKNEYTITAKDLKSRKRKFLKERSRDVNLEGQKRGRVRKDASGKECSRN